MNHYRRRLVLLAASAPLAVPLIPRAQPDSRMRRIGVLMDLAADHPQAKPRIAALLEGLQQLGWNDGRNLRIDYRWGASEVNAGRKFAAELIALTPDVLLASGSLALTALRQASSTLPIVFVSVADPVGSGFVASLARPGGNATGFTVFDYSMSAKWLELLKQIAPSVTRVAVLRDTANVAGAGQFGAIQAVAPSFRVEVRPIDVREAGEIQRAIAEFVRGPNGGLIVTGSSAASVHRELIIRLAAQHRLPAVYPYAHFADAGGLIAYGPDLVAPFGRAAGYLDRILKGEKPGDLPVQAPTKFQLAVNLKTAKALGISIPKEILVRADHVIS
jgi:putative tryptophan/tyrosine transport system substrate-binding protein